MSPDILQLKISGWRKGFDSLHHRDKMRMSQSLDASFRMAS